MSRQLSRRIPTVTIDGSRTESAEVVELDQVAAARLATEHLLELGHETVWHLAGPLEWLDAASRAHGWRETLESAGRTVPPELHGDWSPESGYQAGLLIGRMPEVTAVFVASDEMAFGVIRALHELGRRVPEDVSIVGFDDIALAAYCSPALTTIAQPFDEIGRRAVAHVLRRIDDPSAAAEPESVSPQLVVRGSTAPPAYGVSRASPRRARACAPAFGRRNARVREAETRQVLARILRRPRVRGSRAGEPVQGS